MPSIPSNLARVPNLLASQIVLQSITNTNQRLLNAQVQLSTGRLINRPSDNAVWASTISVLDDILEKREQRVRNLSHAEAVLNNTDAALAEASELLLEAKAIALSQTGAATTAEERANQAAVIDSTLREMVRISNKQYQQLYLFGGRGTAQPPLVELLGQYRYRGHADGLVTDIGLSHTVPITTSGADAFGALSARVQGDHDLEPGMIATTRLADLNGARGLGVSLGSISIDVGGTEIIADLSTAHTVSDVASILQTAIQSLDPGATISIDAATNDRFAIAGNSVAITISDLSTPATAADLGLTGTYAVGGGSGADVDPRLTAQSDLSAFSGFASQLGLIRLANAGQTRDLDLSAEKTMQDVINAVAGLNIGIRLEIAESGDRLNIINELSGSPSGAMSVGEVAGGTTATLLGIRSLTNSTLLADFNHGLGVQIKTGSVDPITGLPDPAADVDFTITMKDGRAFDVDLEDVTTVQDVLDQITAASALAGIAGSDFQVGLAQDGNGIVINDSTIGIAGVSTTTITAVNGSLAAEHLGLLGSTTSATLIGQDRATVAVDGVFSHLISLRDALLANNDHGIDLATQKLQDDITRVTTARAGVGVRTRVVTDAAAREEDLKVQDTALRSQFQDLDYTEAAVRFATLQQQLQAALATAARTTSMSLLDFLK